MVADLEKDAHPMPLPTTAAPTFTALQTEYQKRSIEFPQLKAVTFAQWAKESGWGGSDLAKIHRNYGGAKWRAYMNPYAKPVSYKAHDGETLYCSFNSLPDWIDGFWARFDLEAAYAGWRNHTKNGATFMKFVGPIWLGMGTKAGDNYVRDVIRIHDQYKFADEFMSQVFEDENALLDWDDLRRLFAPPAAGV